MCTYVCMHVHVRTVRVYVCTWVYVFVCVCCVSICVCCVSIYVCVCMSVRVCVCMYMFCACVLCVCIYLRPGITSANKFQWFWILIERLMLVNIQQYIMLVYTAGFNYTLKWFIQLSNKTQNCLVTKWEWHACIQVFKNLSSYLVMHAWWRYRKLQVIKKEAIL